MLSPLFSIVYISTIVETIFEAIYHENYIVTLYLGIEKKEKISQASNIFVHELFQKKQRIIFVWISTVDHFQIA